MSSRPENPTGYSVSDTQSNSERSHSPTMTRIMGDKTPRSETSSPSRKHPSGDNNDDTQSPKRGRTNSSAGFTENDKKGVCDMSNEKGTDECWFCGYGRGPFARTSALQNAHVVGKAHPGFDIFIKKNDLIDIRDINDRQNGIRLCTGCHGAFDDNYTPTHLFWPQDLAFFYTAELKDRIKRRNALPKETRRCVPTAEDYRKHCAYLNCEGSHWAGMYERATLLQVQSDTRTDNFVPGPCVLGKGQYACWRGSPMAALHKAAAGVQRMLGAPGIPVYVDTMFSLLRRLYLKPLLKNEPDYVLIVPPHNSAGEREPYLGNGYFTWPDSKPENQQGESSGTGHASGSGSRHGQGKTASNKFEDVVMEESWIDGVDSGVNWSFSRHDEPYLSHGSSKSTTSESTRVSKALKVSFEPILELATNKNAAVDHLRESSSLVISTHTLPLPDETATTMPIELTPATPPRSPREKNMILPDLGDDEPRSVSDDEFADDDEFDNEDEDDPFPWDPERRTAEAQAYFRNQLY